MTSKKIEPEKEANRKKEFNNDFLLILHNDDIHSFDYVTEALIDICNHNYEQAVQCTLITHYKGSCDIYRGESAIMKKMKEEFYKKKLKVTIETAL